MSGILVKKIFNFLYHTSNKYYDNMILQRSHHSTSITFDLLYTYGIYHCKSKSFPDRQKLCNFVEKKPSSFVAKAL
ncbi:hypothetical protein Syun_019179 [Stephania yunnanensis]|uniref:Uncharacterized protein n=1 Tax=Stephania yunnanensis TaxID=152371 RepID=A0AAP0IVL4_9MAGN